MEALAIVTSLALIQIVFFSFQVGASRQKHGISAPKTVGEDAFEREFRVHQNTVEQFVVFMPALWLFGYFVNPNWAAGIGVVFIVSRFMYRSAYTGDPAKRGMPFTIGLLCMAVLVLGTIIGVTMSLFGLPG